MYKTGANEVTVLEAGQERVKVEYTACTVRPDGSDEPLPHPDCVLWNPWVDKVGACVYLRVRSHAAAVTPSPSDV